MTASSHAGSLRIAWYVPSRQRIPLRSPQANLLHKKPPATSFSDVDILHLKKPPVPPLGGNKNSLRHSMSLSELSELRAAQPPNPLLKGRTRKNSEGCARRVEHEGDHDAHQLSNSLYAGEWSSAYHSSDDSDNGSSSEAGAHDPKVCNLVLSVLASFCT